MLPRTEQILRVRRDIALAIERAESGDDDWDAVYSADGDRVREGLADLAAGRVQAFVRAADLLRTQEGG